MELDQLIYTHQTGKGDRESLCR